MKKIDLITGFLGAGKTTFIKNYVNYLTSIGEKVCILENDFGAVNVDMMLLQELRSDNCELEMVSGGCDRDCHLRRFKTKLIAMGMDDYTRVIVEPSGIFDVDEFFDSLYDEPICNWYEIGCVIGILDAYVDKSLSEESRYVLASEMASAGKIVLSKVDNLKARLDDAEVKKIIEGTKSFVKDCLKEFSCSRELSDDFIEKDWKELSGKDFEEISNSGYKKANYIKKSDSYDCFDSIYFLDHKLQSEAIERFAKTLLTDIKYGNVCRVKGFFKNGDSWVEINADKSIVDMKSISEGQDVIIVIGENLKKDLVEELYKNIN